MGLLCGRLVYGEEPLEGTLRLLFFGLGELAGLASLLAWLACCLGSLAGLARWLADLRGLVVRLFGLRRRTAGGDPQVVVLRSWLIVASILMLRA